MAMTVGFAVVGAFILSLTYVPMMSAMFLSKNTEHKPNFSDKMMAWFEKIYTPFLDKIEYIGWKNWSEKLIATSFMAPIFMFFLYLIFKFLA